MSDQRDEHPPTIPSTPAATGPEAGAPLDSNRIKKRQFLGTIAALMIVVIFLQWPALKEWFYQVSGRELPESTIAWRQDYETALMEARSSGKPLLLVFSASWCPPCKVMKREVWPDEQVTAAVETNFVPLYLDVDLEKHAEAAARYQVRSVPTILVVDEDGQVLQQAGPMSRSRMLDFLEASEA